MELCEIRGHMAALALGFLLDLLLGDPYSLPHPVRWIGALIQKLEGAWNKWEQPDTKEKQLFWGGMLAVVCPTLVCLVTMLVLSVFYQISFWLGVLAEAVMTYRLLAVKCLKAESMKVYEELKRGETKNARRAVANIVGRDVNALDEAGIVRAAVETVAENTSDGVVAPLLYTALGGPVLGFFYKTVNTMDSMVGYKNERFLYFGRCAARLDDVVNFVPSRLSAGLMIISCFLFPQKEMSGREAWRIYRRDKKKHASPNAGQTESVCAGALGIRLGGDAVYFGRREEKPFLGDDLRPVEYEDIRRANRLLYQTAWLCLALVLAVWSAAAVFCAA